MRRREHRDLRAQGRETLTRTRYLWLKNPRNWTERQPETFQSIKEAFAPLWNYHYTGSARKFFDRWYFWATHSRLPPIITAAKTLKRHLPGLLAYTKHRITNAMAEGTNGRIQLNKANARGYRNFAQYRRAAVHHRSAWKGGVDGEIHGLFVWLAQAHSRELVGLPTERRRHMLVRRRSGESFLVFTAHDV